MDVVERYLHAIEFWLPKEQKRDIIAEIAEDLHSQIDDRREQLGRELNEAELAALIKQRGAPVLVANRYVPQRFLIGPVLFPIYVFVLKICSLCYLVPWLAVFVTVHRVLHPVSSWTETVGAAASSLWTAAFTAGGLITLAFVIFERVDARTRLLENWDPRRLPPARDPNKISRANSVFDLAISLAVLVWWSGQAWSPSVLNVEISFAPVWVYFYWGFLAVTLLNAALSVVNLMRPYWTGIRAAWRLVLDAMGSALFCWLLKANVIASLQIAGLDPSRTQAIGLAIRTWMDRAFPLAVLGCAVIVACDLYRIVRVNRSGAAPGREALAVLSALLLALPWRG